MLLLINLLTSHANYTQTVKWNQVRETFTDWKTWPIAIFIFLSEIGFGATSGFAAQIVSGLGFDALETTLLGIPAGIIATFTGIIVTTFIGKVKNVRCLVSGLWSIIPLIAIVLIMSKSLASKLRS